MVDNNRKNLLIELFESEQYVPMKFKELAVFLQVPKDDKQELNAVLDELVAEGKVILDSKGRYKIPGDDVVIATFCGTQKGFGFATIDGGEDIYIGKDDKKDAFDGDKVLVQVNKNQVFGKKKEGVVIKVLERKYKQVIGTYQKSNNYGFVIPDNQKIGCDIYIPNGKNLGCANGAKVVVDLISYGSATKNPEGIVVEILGMINEKGVDVLSVIKALNIPVDFPDEVINQLDSIPDEVLETEKEGRYDVRDLLTVTIDGADAKDLDDAITLQKQGDIYTLGVHIADVSHYVKEGSPLDKAALERGTSVYLVDRVIPMLPKKLSNGICSLNQGTDRLALSCFMDIDNKGNVINHHIENAIINVNRRMTYDEVNQIILDNQAEIIKSDSNGIINKLDKSSIVDFETRLGKDYISFFLLMKELATILNDKRKKRGSINFDFPETKIIIDDNGRPIDIKPYQRNIATNIIEEFMLITNETIAQDYFWQEIPFLYRTHENPDQEKIVKLGIFINNFGYTLKGGNETHPKEIQKLLTKIEGTPEEMLISRLALRSMKQAKYSPECSGHFGLAAKYYCHFTSPIRRYPDLQIHRIIKENISKGLSEKRISHYDGIMSEVAVQTSRTERRAEEAEREVEKMKKAEYMEGHIGDVYEGVISGVTSWGLYVELPNTVEGMVRMQDLIDDYYIFDEAGYQLIGEDTGKSYKLGQRLKVFVSSVNIISRTIDLTPILPHFGI